MTIALGIIYVIVAVAVVVLVMLQESNSAGLGAMAGSVDMGGFGGKNRTKNSLLSKLTIVGAVILVVLTIVLTVVA